MVALLCAPAAAQVQLGTIEVEAARPEERAAPLDDEDAVPWKITIDARQPSARVTSVAELVGARAGVQVRSRGGLGSFTSVSLRGSDANEVAIFVDGVPINRGASGVIDLSLLPVDGVERVEIYRGAAPIDLGAEAVGGVINIITRKGGRRQVRASVGGGSFGARAASAGLSTGGPLRVDATASYRGATGDFTYYDYNGTLRDPTDDHAAVRHNNGFDQVALDTSVGAGGALRWRLGSHGFWKRQGVPGLGSTGAETTSAKLTTGRALVDGELTRTGRLTDLRLSAFVLYERIAYANPHGEHVGQFGPQVTDGESLAAGADARLDAPWGTHQLWTALCEARVEHRTPYDLLQPSRAGRPSTRGLGAVGVGDDLRFFGDRLAVTAGARLDGVASTLVLDADGRAVPDQRTADWFISPRLAVRARVLPWLALRGSAGRFVRFPTLLEQFGDGAFILGRPQLRPESSWGGDAGAALSVERPRGALLLEAIFFGRQVSDYIAFVPAANAATVLNIGDTRMLGAEARVAVRIQRWASLTVDYTFLDAVNLTDEPGTRGKQLPGRPRHSLVARGELAGGPFRLFYELDFVDDVFRDAQNYNVIPGRALHALGASFVRAPILFSVEVRNLADLRVVQMPLGGRFNAGLTVPYPLADFFDYPLPGRAIYATLTLQK
jgi:iron complex outermembrane receptor protein